MRNLVWQPLLWGAVGLGFLALSRGAGEAPTSPLWFGELGLYALMLHQSLRGGPRLAVPERRAGLVYVALVLLFGAIYEASLTVDGSGIGGVHPDTGASYLLALGDYLMLAMAALWLIRRYGLGFREVFFLAAGMSLSEGLIFTGVLSGVLVSGPWVLVPLVLAYYALAYASFIALPLLVLPEGALVRGSARLGIAALWAVGFGVAFCVRLIWGLGYAPLVTWLFGLPENTVGMLERAVVFG